MIYVISDTHSDIEKAEKDIAYIEKTYGHSLDEHDTLLCAGDLIGAVSSDVAERMRKDIAFIEWMSEKPFAIVSVLGNHDTRQRIATLAAIPDEAYGSDVMRLLPNAVYLMNGSIYDIPCDACEEGSSSISVLAIGGAFEHTYRLRSRVLVDEVFYGRQYLHITHAAEPVSVDCVLSHEGPFRRLGAITQMLYDHTPATDVCDKVDANTECRQWFFGHHHADFTNDGKYRCVFRRPAAVDVPNASEPLSSLEGAARNDTMAQEYNLQ